MNKWYVYIVLCIDNTLYTGVTNNINKRVREHNTSKRGAKYTKTRRPVRLVYLELFDSRSEAQRREYKIKQLSKQDKNKLIQKYVCVVQNASGYS